jgi:hypothetical protein
LLVAVVDDNKNSMFEKKRLIRQAGFYTDRASWVGFLDGIEIEQVNSTMHQINKLCNNVKCLRF